MHVLSEIDMIQHAKFNRADATSDVDSKASTYGEFGLLSLDWALNICREHAEPGQLRVCYDLGSGSGRLVLFLALVTDMVRICGIEFLPSLYKTAIGILKDCEESVQMVPGVSFVHGDFFDHDWSDADLVVCTSTCFTHIMDRIEDKAIQSLKLGSFVITVTHRFKSDCWEELAATDRRHSWGRGRVYVMRLRSRQPINA